MKWPNGIKVTVSNETLNFIKNNGPYSLPGIDKSKINKRDLDQFGGALSSYPLIQFYPDSQLIDTITKSHPENVTSVFFYPYIVPIPYQAPCTTPINIGCQTHPCNPAMNVACHDIITTTVPISTTPTTTTTRRAATEQVTMRPTSARWDNRLWPSITAIPTATSPTIKWIATTTMPTARRTNLLEITLWGTNTRKMPSRRLRTSTTMPTARRTNLIETTPLGTNTRKMPSRRWRTSTTMPTATKMTTTRIASPTTRPWWDYTEEISR
ncbi:uncharacterized protein isoform X2 [Rhodnius prolixus]